MELLLAIVLGAIALFLVYKAMNKENPDGRHPLDSLVKKSNDVPVVNNKTGDAVETPAWHTAPASDPQPVVLTDVLDVNKDGKVDLKDAVEVVKKTRTRVKKAADVDGDGKVTVKDAKAAAKTVKKKVAKVVEKPVATKRGRSKKA